MGKARARAWVAFGVEARAIGSSVKGRFSMQGGYHTLDERGYYGANPNPSTNPSPNSSHAVRQVVGVGVGVGSGARFSRVEVGVGHGDWGGLVLLHLKQFILKKKYLNLLRPSASLPV